MLKRSTELMRQHALLSSMLCLFRTPEAAGPGAGGRGCHQMTTPLTEPSGCCSAFLSSSPPDEPAQKATPCQEGIGGLGTLTQYVTDRCQRVCPIPPCWLIHRCTAEPSHNWATLKAL